MYKLKSMAGVSGLAVVALLGLNGFLLYKVSNSNSSMNSVVAANSELSRLHHSFRSEVMDTHRSQMSLLNTQMSDLQLENVSTQERVNLQQLLTGEQPKIVVYFSPSQCHTCIEHEIPRIKAFADSANNHQVVFLVSNANQEFIRRFALVKNVRLPFYLIINPTELNEIISKADAPYAMLVNQERVIVKACSLSASLEKWSDSFYASFRTP